MADGLTGWIKSAARKEITMSDGNRVITDKSVIREILQNYFIDHNVFIRTTELNIQVDSFSYSDGKMHVKIGGDNPDLGKALLYVRNNKEVLFTHTSFISRDENGIYVFDPVDVQIMQIPRKEERKETGTGEPECREPVFISNILSDFLLKEFLNYSKKKVEFLKDEILKKIQPSYPDSDIFFFNAKGHNARMEYFIKERSPYYIPDMENRTKLENDDFGKYYLAKIAPSDTSESNIKRTSEIAVPLLYRFMLPFGYILINRDTELTGDDFVVIKKTGMSLSTIFTNDRQMIKCGEDRIGVTDMSESGVGLLFKERSLIKYFKDGCTLVCTIYMPDKKTANIFCIVRNINMLKNSIYRIGCEIISMDSIGEVNYSEYLETLM